MISFYDQSMSKQRISLIEGPFKNSPSVSETLNFLHFPAKHAIYNNYFSLKSQVKKFSFIDDFSRIHCDRGPI